ncbi:hypothetical protein ACFQY7_19670 [Actinomadura luteofluorescens]|uniref:hypothetical protein n=1 Tax=Actinomadura luteofluorescens TaxID=46163 RepID=UPI00363DF560
MTTPAFDSASLVRVPASKECGSCAGSLMNEVTFTLSPPICRAMSPYTLVEATTGTVSAAPAPEEDPQAEAPRAERARAAPAPRTRAR